jgi:dual specificity protein kinase YAK1
MLSGGKQTGQFFDAAADPYTGQKKFQLKSLEKYSREHNTNEQPGKQYFNGKSLPEIVNNTPLPQFKSSRQAQDTEKGLC